MNTIDDLRAAAAEHNDEMPRRTCQEGVGPSSRVISRRYAWSTGRASRIGYYNSRMKKPSSHPLYFDGILAQSPDRLQVVYGLIDPDEPGRIRYVGCTSSPQGRYLMHVRRPGSHGLRKWIATLHARGRQPVMVALEKGLPTESPHAGGAAEREAVWINHLRSLGEADLNVRTTVNAPRRGGIA